MSGKKKKQPWIPKGRMVYEWTDLLFIGEELGYNWNEAHDIVIWCNPRFHGASTVPVDLDELRDNCEDSQKILKEFFKRAAVLDTVEFI